MYEALLIVVFHTTVRLSDDDDVLQDLHFYRNDFPTLAACEQSIDRLKANLRKRFSVANIEYEFRDGQCKPLGRGT